MFGIDIRTVSYLRRYCSRVSNFLRFERADEGRFCDWYVKCAKYLAFGTFERADDSALMPIKYETFKKLYINK